jgi:hypothetical protein
VRSWRGEAVAGMVGSISFWDIVSQHRIAMS